MINREATKDFLGSHRTLGLGKCVATLVASAAGVWIIFSPVETISWAGVAGLTGYAVGQALPFLALAFIGVRMLRLLPEGHSLPQWAGIRYGAPMRIITFVVCVFNLVIYLSAELTAIGLAGELLTPVPGWIIVAVVTFLTWSYTYRGGFNLVVLTDMLQLIIFLPILLVIFFVLLDFSPQPWLSNIAENEPQLLSFKHLPGVEFGITLMIAIVASQIFNQSLWQRVYAAADDNTMRKAFLITALCIIPIVFATGFLGLLARDAGVGLDAPAAGIFALLAEHSIWWLSAGFGLVAVLLVMSSADSILNGLAALVSEEIEGVEGAKGTSKKKPDRTGRARMITSVFAVIIAVVASQGYSVLYLFLLADLLCAASLVPIFAGLYTDKLSQRAAITSLVLGLVIGTMFMLRPDLTTPMFSNPLNAVFGSSWLLSFGSAFVVSSLSTALFVIFARKPAGVVQSG